MPETARLVRDAGRNAVLGAGEIQASAHCRKIIDPAVSELGGIDILVNNAAIRRRSIASLTFRTGSGS